MNTQDQDVAPEEIPEEAVTAALEVFFEGRGGWDGDAPDPDWYRIDMQAAIMAAVAVMRSQKL